MEHNLKILNEGFKRKYFSEAVEKDDEYNANDLFLEGYDDLDECGLNEAAVDPETEKDSEILRGLTTKLAGQYRRGEHKNLYSPEEKKVLNKYGLKAYTNGGYTNWAQFKTPGGRNLDLNMSNNKINIADQAKKVDARHKASGDIKYSTYFPDLRTFQDKNNDYVNRNMSKNYQELQHILNNNKQIRQAYDDIDNSYNNELDHIYNNHYENSKQMRGYRNYMDSQSDYYDDRIQGVLDKYRNRLNKKIGECLNKLTEAQMSDEDRKDSEMLRNIQSKINRRRNAKLTPEENAVLDKYNLIRDSNTDTTYQVRTKSNDRPLQIDRQYRSRNPLDVNLADKARKISTRDKYNSRRYGTLADERNYINDLMSDDIRKVKSDLKDRNAFRKFADTQEAEFNRYQDDLNNRVKDATSRRDEYRSYYQSMLDKNQDKIDSILRRNKKAEK